MNHEHLMTNPCLKFNSSIFIKVSTNRTDVTMNNNENASRTCKKSCLRNEQNSKTNKTVQSIQWSSKCKLRFIDLIAKEHIHNIWYNQEDCQSFRNERKIVLKHVKAFGGVEAVEKTGIVTCRGMEHMVSKSRKREVQDFRRKAWDSVMDEQSDQCQEGIRRPEIIAALYRAISEDAELAAHARALAYYAAEAHLTVENILVDSTTKNISTLSSLVDLRPRFMRKPGFRNLTTPMA
jgi:hypothetical protein